MRGYPELELDIFKMRLVCLDCLSLPFKECHMLPRQLLSVEVVDKRFEDLYKPLVKTFDYGDRCESYHTSR